MMKLLERKFVGNNILSLKYEYIDNKNKKYHVSLNVDLESNITLEKKVDTVYEDIYGRIPIYCDSESKDLFTSRFIEDWHFIVNGGITFKEIIETKKMTLAEIENKLGCKIELVSNK